VVELSTNTVRMLVSRGRRYSTVSPVFELTLLRTAESVAELPTAKLEEALGQLVLSELVFCRGEPGWRVIGGLNHFTIAIEYTRPRVH
jgi:hypothetical protein